MLLSLVLGWFGTAAAPAQRLPETIGIDTLLRRESELSQLPRLRDETSHLQSSYDRSGGNGDLGQYLDFQGATATIADMAGPGAIVRLWSANPAEQIKIYIDDNPTPVVDAPFAKLFDGTLSPFTPPLARPSSGGFYSYVPIPYAKHCRITVENAAKPDELKHLYYQVNYVSFRATARVRSFALPLTPADQNALSAAVAAWKVTNMSIPRNALIKSRSTTVGEGKTETIDRETGSALIRQLEMRFPDVDDAGLRQIVLRAYFDGHSAPDIEAPIADFFGNAYGRKLFQSLLLSQKEAGVLESRFPMPFGQSARFTIENGTKKALNVVWNVTMTREPFHPGDEGYFHARWWQETTRRGVPHVWARVTGQRGHFVGVVQTMSGKRSLGYLEGDDQFRVDEQTWGASRVASTVIGPWNGTGTEDCFNSGWYFDNGTNSLPVNGLLIKAQSGNVSRIDVFRWFLNDAPVFQQSMDAQIEHGGQNDVPGVYYSSVAYWYADGPVEPWSVTPEAARIAPLPALQANVASLVLKNAVEGEAMLAAAKATGGKVAAQEMWDFEGDWSGGRQLFWTGAKTGDALRLNLAAPAAGAYDLTGYFTKAADYGQARFTVNGRDLEGVYDAYHDGVVASGPVPLGRVTLVAGPNQFVVTLAGRNAASTNTFFGLDAVVLKPAAEK